jgi:hypothetical protein
VADGSAGDTTSMLPSDLTSMRAVPLSPAWCYPYRPVPLSRLPKQMVPFNHQTVTHSGQTLLPTTETNSAWSTSCCLAAIADRRPYRPGLSCTHWAIVLYALRIVFVRGNRGSFAVARKRGGRLVQVLLCYHYQSRLWPDTLIWVEEKNKVIAEHNHYWFRV